MSFSALLTKPRQRLKRDLANHVLIQIDSHPFPAFTLKPPANTRYMSCLILFTTEGIVITGDLCPCPGTNGVVSRGGYHLPWFRSDLDPLYLCEKFLTTRYVPEYALECAKDLAQEHGWTPEQIHQLPTQIDFDDENHVYRWASETFAVSDAIEHAYNIGDAAVLCEIQSRFAELYNQSTSEEHTHD